LNPLPDIYFTAIKAIIAASEVVMKVYQTDFTAIQKEDGSPVTEADFASSQIIYNYLSTTNIPITEEEKEIADYAIRSTWTESWCVDPLDGTRMFIKRNDEFSINIAHIVGNKSEFGVIGSPTSQQLILGGPKYGVYFVNFNDINDFSAWQKVDQIDEVNNPLTVICSRSHIHGTGFKYMQILEKVFGEMTYLRKGSALKFFDLANGNADIYTRFAPTMEWDIAAGHAILEALGGQIVEVETNKPLIYNKESLFNPYFIAKSKAFIAI
jgi:3'(2'), 5'-bisphosphate nucleotidase